MKTFRCNFLGCDKVFRSAKVRDNHIKDSHQNAKMGLFDNQRRVNLKRQANDSPNGKLQF